MKRYQMLMPLLLLLFIGLSACTAPKQATQNGADDIAMDTMYNQKTGQALSLGMTREAVEKLLGKGTEQTPLWPEGDVEAIEDPAESVTTQDDVQYMSYGDGAQLISVCYREDIVVSLFNYGNYEAEGPGPRDWALKYGLRYGDSLETIFDKLGEAETTSLIGEEDGTGKGLMLHTPNATWIKPVIVFYAFDKEGKPVDGTTEEAIDYQVLLIVDEEQDGLMLYGIARL